MLKQSIERAACTATALRAPAPAAPPGPRRNDGPDGLDTGRPEARASRENLAITERQPCIDASWPPRRGQGAEAAGRQGAARQTAALLVAALLVAGLLVASLAGSPARAHAFLRRASPAVGGVVSKPPTRLVIDFTEEVEPAFSSITVTGPDGRRVDSGAVREAGAARLAVGLQPLPPGRYRVNWHVTATDTHKTTGSFVFTVRAGGS